MLSELKETRQIEEEGFRRWFRDQDFDLILWYESPEAKEPEGFQLCYDKQGEERCLTWRKSQGYQHHAVDDGEAPYSNKMTPILVQDGIFDTKRVKADFLSSAAEVDPSIVDFVTEKLDSYV